MAQLVSNDALWEKLSEVDKKLEKYIQGLGTHCDSHFKVIHEKLELLEKDTEGVYKILSCISDILKET